MCVRKKGWIIFSVVAVGLLTALVVASRSGAPQVDVENIDVNTVQVASDANGNIGDQVFGKTSSKVTLIEYGDFQCPGCKSAQPRVEAISEAYKDHITFVFRNFPLATIHANARAAAGAAEAAGLQDKYWEYHALLYDNQNVWKGLTDTDRTNVFVSYASSLGLDTARFTTDLGEAAIGQKISFDQALGKKSRVDSTPTFFLNGTKLESDVWGSEAKLVEAINAELEKAGVTPPEYTPTE